MKRLKIILPVLLLTLIVILFYNKPRKLKYAYQPYFSQLNTALKVEHSGESAGIIDLDRLDNNVEVVQNKLSDNFKLRLVAKSLPSLELLQYLMEKANTHRLMVFSEPFIEEILNHFNADSLDIILGKPLPVAAVERLSKTKGWNTVCWLVDTKERLNEYLEFAEKNKEPLRISLEINVGLQRGGFETPEQLLEAITIIKANSLYLEFTGLMGYDGHVPFVPFYINKEKAIAKAFAKTQKKYSAFVEELKKHYSDEFVSTLTFNSGGSRTYFYYKDYTGYTPVNDIAMGSGFLCPAQFPELEKIGHQPALFLSSPVLKKIETALLPHAEKISPLVNWWNPNFKVSYFMISGGFAGDLEAPAGLVNNSFWNENDKGFSNLLPNQAIYSSSEESVLQVNDFVFLRAWEGDGMLSFSQVLLYRNNEITGSWKTYSGGN